MKVKLSFAPFLYRKQVFVLALFHGLLLAGLLLYVDPQFVQDVGWSGSHLPFIYLLLAFTFLSLWTSTGRWKRSLLWSILITALVWLRLYQLGGPINVVLLLCFGLVWEYYWKISKNQSSL